MPVICENKDETKFFLNQISVILTVDNFILNKLNKGMLPYRSSTLNLKIYANFSKSWNLVSIAATATTTMRARLSVSTKKGIV